MKIIEQSVPGHCEIVAGLFVVSKVHEQQIKCLIDTGSTITILSKTVYESFPDDKRPICQTTSTPVLSADGTPLKVYGYCMFPIQIGTKQFEHDFWIADIQADGILGIDFMKENKCSLDLENNVFKLGPDQIRCISENLPVPMKTCCRIVLAETKVIPPKHETILPGTALIKSSANITGLVEPINSFGKKTGVMVAKTLVDTVNHIIPIRVFNPSNETQIVYKDMSLALLHPISTIVDNMKRADHEKYTQDVACTRLQVNEQTIPPYLQDLYANSIKYLDEHQSEHVKKLLCDYQDIFTKTNQDLGRTNIIKHGINTGVQLQ